MNNLRRFSPGPAQSAANHIHNTLHNVAADVRELSGAVDDLRSQREDEAKRVAPTDSTSHPDPPPEFQSSAPPPAPGLRPPAPAPASEGQDRGGEGKTTKPVSSVNLQQNVAIELPSDRAGAVRRPFPTEAGVVSPPPARPAARNGEHKTDAATAPASPERRIPAAVLPRPAASPAANGAGPLVLPAVPDVSRQLQIFVATVIQNQETILRTLQQLTALYSRQQPQTDALAGQIQRLSLHARRDFR